MDRTPTFDERFDDLAALAYQVAYRLVGDRHVAENHAQETMARAFARWSKIAGYDEAWVVRVTTNLVIGRWRRFGPERLEPAGPAPGADHQLVDRLEVKALLKRLPKRQRQVLALRYLGDLTEAQTAEALGCSIGTVKQHAHRALSTLRESTENDHSHARPTQLRGVDHTLAASPESSASTAAPDTKEHNHV